MNKVITAFIVVLFLGVICIPASADVIRLDETFQSGATFTGNLTFSSDFTNLLSVTGTLSGGSYGASDAITWSFFDVLGMTSQDLGSGIYADFLMDGSAASRTFRNYIEIDWSDIGGNLILTNSAGSYYGGPGANEIDQRDALKTYSFHSVSSVPEPSSLALLALGLVGLGIVGRVQRRNSATAASHLP